MTLNVQLLFNYYSIVIIIILLHQDVYLQSSISRAHSMEKKVNKVLKLVAFLESFKSSFLDAFILALNTNYIYGKVNLCI